MVHHEHTWRLPTFALPDTSSKGFACLPCDPNDIFSSHYSANSFAVLNCLDTEKTCPEEADQQLVMQSAGTSYVQPQAGDETHREYLEILYEKEAMRLHCAFGHCSDKKLLLSLEKHNIPHRHLRKYISGLTCQACLLSLGHRQYRTLKSTISSSKQLAVNSNDLPGNRSKFEISTLVTTADATSILAALFNDLLASKHADTLISILSFHTQAELSHARVKQKRAALDTLHGSAADDPGIVKLKACKQELDEFIEMAEMIDA